MTELTLALIKPDAWARKLAGKIISEIEGHGFKIRSTLYFRFTKKEAGFFYKAHEGRDYYEPWIEFMSSGPTMALVLEKDNAIADWRALMGSTNPDVAGKDTIRGKWAEAINRNLVHGSDSVDAAKDEIDFFFEDSDLWMAYKD